MCRYVSKVCIARRFCAQNLDLRKHCADLNRQDPEASPSAAPNFMIKLNNDEELTFNFKIVARQTSPSSTGNGPPVTPTGLVDTVINGLTYVSASTAKEVDNLVTTEFHADPNLHKNANVHLVGDFATGGSKSVTFDFNWTWKPPKPTEDKGGGWRNHCSVGLRSVNSKSD